MQFQVLVSLLPLLLPASALVLPRAANSQTFTGTLGGTAAPPVTDSGDSTRPFLVNGNTFVNEAAAVQRSCDIQNNACSNAANSGGGFSVGDCNTQQAACNAAASSGTATAATPATTSSAVGTAPSATTSAAVTNTSTVADDTCDV